MYDISAFFDALRREMNALAKDNDHDNDDDMADKHPKNNEN